MSSASTAAITSAANRGPTNQHFSVDTDGKEVVDLSFKSEGLGLPAEKGYGWAQLEFGEHIGDDQRYTIARKLGWGMYSSTWLALDTMLNQYVAIKVLTGHAAEMYERAVTWEPDALRLLSYTPQSEHCVRLLAEEFTMPGRGSAGTHRCFVLPLYGGDVKALLHSRGTTPLPIPLAKRIALHLLRGLAFAHGRHIVHTDLKADNILFTTGATRADVDRWIKEDPPRRNPPEMSSDGIVASAVSQPMKLPSEDEALKATYVLSDFGSAQPSNLHANRTITTPQHRAPEVLLGGEWDKPADIWAFGCLAYELVTSRALFSYRPNDVYGFSATGNLLYQMALKTGESFRAAQLKTWPKAIDYFHPENCRLRGDPRIFDYGIEYNIGRLGIMSWDDSLPVSEFIRRCLRLNPEERATAKDLLEDEWLAGVE